MGSRDGIDARRIYEEEVLRAAREKSKSQDAQLAVESVEPSKEAAEQLRKIAKLGNPAPIPVRKTT